MRAAFNSAREKGPLSQLDVPNAPLRNLRLWRPCTRRDLQSLDGARLPSQGIITGQVDRPQPMRVLL
jgi:hypothetical protein